MIDRKQPTAGRTVALATMPFPERLATIRKDRHLTQQALADLAKIHVSMIRKYETGVGQPSIDVLRRLAVSLSVPTDLLVFDDAERGPDDDLRLEFESTARLDPDEKQVVRTVIRSLVLQHEARRLGITQPVEQSA
jgi:transcriptional regulator with XRE-family HTH domain